MPRPAPFRRIAADLREAIRRGEYAPGHQLPSASALVERYGRLARPYRTRSTCYVRKAWFSAAKAPAGSSARPR